MLQSDKLHYYVDFQYSVIAILTCSSKYNQANWFISMKRWQCLCITQLPFSCYYARGLMAALISWKRNEQKKTNTRYAKIRLTNYETIWVFCKGKYINSGKKSTHSRQRTRDKSLNWKPSGRMMLNASLRWMPSSQNWMPWNSRWRTISQTLELVIHAGEERHALIQNLWCIKV